MTGHEAAARHLAEQVGGRTALRPQFVHDLQSAHAVAGDHVRIVVRRRLDRSLRLGDLARQPVPFPGLVVAGDVVRADLRAERARQFHLHARRRVGHDHDHPLAEPHAGERDPRREVAGGVSDDRPVADARQVAHHPVQRAEQLERADGCPPIVLQPHPPRLRHAELPLQRMRPDQWRRGGKRDGVCPARPHVRRRSLRPGSPARLLQFAGCIVDDRAQRQDVLGPRRTAAADDLRAGVQPPPGERGQSSRRVVRALQDVGTDARALVGEHRPVRDRPGRVVAQVRVAADRAVGGLAQDRQPGVDRLRVCCTSAGWRREPGPAPAARLPDRRATPRTASSRPRRCGGTPTNSGRSMSAHALHGGGALLDVAQILQQDEVDSGGGRAAAHGRRSRQRLRAPPIRATVGGEGLRCPGPAAPAARCRPPRTPTVGCRPPARPARLRAAASA